MRRVAELHEFNPMLGHRGCRLGIAYPEITEMQARAIFEAAVEVSQEEGFAVVPEIMVPLVAFKKELDIQKAIIDKVAKQVFEEKGAKVDYLVGTMIEIPRAAVTADEIAETAQFFSFGTNDLTQYTLACDRQNNDLGRFYDPHNPAVLRLLKMVTENAHKNGIWVGICGELGADLTLTETFLAIGVDELSVSPRAVLPLRNAVRMTDTRESAPRLLAAIDAEFPETL